MNKDYPIDSLRLELETDDFVFEWYPNEVRINGEALTYFEAFMLNCYSLWILKTFGGYLNSDWGSAVTEFRSRLKVARDLADDPVYIRFTYSPEDIGIENELRIYRDGTLRVNNIRLSETGKNLIELFYIYLYAESEGYDDIPKSFRDSIDLFRQSLTIPERDLEDYIAFNYELDALFINNKIDPEI